MLKNTPLHIACKFGHLLIVKYLLEQGANIDLANAYSKNSYELAEESIELASYNYNILSKGREQKMKEQAQQEVVTLITNL